MQICKALPSDCDKVLQLLYLAMEDIAHALTATSNKNSALEKLQQFYLTESNRLSYENICVAKIDDTVVAAMCAYDGANSPSLNLPFIEYLKQRQININELDAECFDDEYYVDSLAVDANYRKLGIAKSMFDYAENLARSSNRKKLALIVDENKKATRAYYEKLGFVGDIILTVNRHKYTHMVKVIH